MYRAFTSVALVVLMTSSAFAAGASCTTSSAAQFKPKSELEAVLKADGLTMKKLKVEKGCYEVYATDKDGKKVNVAYNAETLEKVSNPEAGEN
ncbi:MAG: PepSY domain-containing protein [Aestuariivirga sp.]